MPALLVSHAEPHYASRAMALHVRLFSAVGLPN